MREPLLKRILKLYEAGESGVDIAKTVEMPETTLRDYKKELIRRKWISQEKIDIARKKKRDKEIQAKKMADPKRKRILDELKNGLLYIEIAELVSMSEQTVRKITKELIAEKAISEAEITAAREARKLRDKEKKKEDEKDKVQDIDEKLTKQILTLLEEGVDGKKITKKLNLGQGVFMKVRRKLINTNQISKEKIKQAEEERLERDKQTVYDLLMEGYTQEEITREMEDVEFSYVKRLVKSLKDEGRIDDAKIKQARYEAREKEIVEFIYQGLTEGYTEQAISDMYDALHEEHLERRRISSYRTKLVAAGRIKEEDIKAIRRSKKELRTKELDEDAEYDEIILRLFNMGFTEREIGIIISEDLEFVQKRKTALMSQLRLAEAVIKKNFENREANAEKRQDKISSIVSFYEDIDEGCIDEYIEYSKAKAILGELGKVETRLLGKVLQMDRKYITLTNINVISRAYNKNYEPEKLVDFINGCMDMIDRNDNKMIILRRVRQVVINGIEKNGFGMRTEQNKAADLRKTDTNTVIKKKTARRAVSQERER